MKIFKVLVLFATFIFLGCSEKLPPNPTVLIPIECQFAPIPPLKMMVINPSDDIEIGLRIQEQSDLKTETLRKCRKVKAN